MSSNQHLAHNQRNWMKDGRDSRFDPPHDQLLGERLQDARAFDPLVPDGRALAAKRPDRMPSGWPPLMTGTLRMAPVLSLQCGPRATGRAGAWFPRRRCCDATRNRAGSRPTVSRRPPVQAEARTYQPGGRRFLRSPGVSHNSQATAAASTHWPLSKKRPAAAAGLAGPPRCDGTRWRPPGSDRSARLLAHFQLGRATSPYSRSYRVRPSAGRRAINALAATFASMYRPSRKTSVLCGSLKTG